MPHIVFLDSDPVLKIAALVLAGEQAHPSIADYFAPEQPAITALVDAVRAIKRHGGISISYDDPAVRASAPGRQADVIVFRRGKVDAALLREHPGVKLVQRLGERSDAIDLEFTRARGIAVSCVPRRTQQYTAEHALLLMLALGKRLAQADRAVRTGDFDASAVRPVNHIAYNWPGIQVEGLAGKTLGIIGLGDIGAMIAQRARAFDMDVIYHKRSRLAAAEEARFGVRHGSLDELLAQSDFVSLNLDNTPANAKFADQAFFARMKPGAYFINTSRGALVDEDALYAALRTGRIAGAGLDVHFPEPRPADDRYAHLSNVILTPHLAGGSRSGVLTELQGLLENIERALGGGLPTHAV